MIPSIVAGQIRETVLDYLRTTFALTDRTLESALFDFLNGENGLFRGPYLDLRLPFRKAESGARMPLEIGPPFTPYRHQLKAFGRLYSHRGHQPQHTLVTTGTGSGKTECFLYPILDHCWRERERPGIKAIVLYPMNALASDQGRRLAQLLWDDPRLRGQVSAGLYVGGKGRHGSASRDHLVDQRDVLRDSPPDILLTNYKMLDFLMLRPEDRKLWRHNGPSTLRYVVLDELHTYDGAQGSDVACLLRRLERRLDCAPGSVCAVGTSATIGSGAQAHQVNELTQFASKLFGQSFYDDAVILEDRLDADEALGKQVDLDRLPPLDQLDRLDARAFRDADHWLRVQVELWLGPGKALTASPGDAAPELDAVALGDQLRRHELLRALLRIADGSLRSFAELDRGLTHRLPGWVSLPAERRPAVLASFLALVSAARRRVSGDRSGTEPFLAMRVHLWMRELRRLLQRVGPHSSASPPEFAWGDDLPAEPLPGNPGGALEALPDRRWLPLAYCWECGGAGLAAFKPESRTRLEADLRKVGRSWFRRLAGCVYLKLGESDPDGAGQAWLCGQCLRLLPDASPDREGAARRPPMCPVCGPARAGVDGAARVAAAGSAFVDPIPHGSTLKDAADPFAVRMHQDRTGAKKAEFAQICPDCGTEGALRILGSRASSLLSVAISHLYQSDFNRDRKLLAFTDSVQDASHRAGFFGARTYRFNLRTALQCVVSGPAEGRPLAELGDLVWEHRDLLAPVARGTGGRGEADRDARVLAALWPVDLRNRPGYAELEAGGVASRELIEDLRSRLSWEAVMEYGLSGRAGRTLANTLCSTVRLESSALERAVEAIALELRENSPLQSPPREGWDEGRVRGWLLGLLQRLRLGGGIDHPFLGTYLREGGGRFLLSKARQPLLSPFGRESVLPRFWIDQPIAVGTTSWFESFVSAQDRPTWMRDWAGRALGVDPRDAGMSDLHREAASRLVDAELLKRRERSGHGHVYGLDPARLELTRHVAAVACSHCRRREVIDAADGGRWRSMPCTRYRCAGRFQVANDVELPYYRHVYQSGRLARIFTQEHTGLLERAERERVEEDFKQGTRPGAPNLFVCTPTLELGIDIGDLSAAVLCSVPPTTANFLQRVGRTGRTTGNAFCLTMAVARNHDLYFHASPSEMMEGAVLPPGCFIDAPEMLRRQLVAYSMDAWAAQEEELTHIPGETGHLLGAAGDRGFPGRFLAYYREHRQKLVQGFLACFEGHLCEESRAWIADFGHGDAVLDAVRGAFARVETELQDLVSRRKAAQRRLHALENQDERPPEDGSDGSPRVRRAANLEEEKDELRNLLRVLDRLQDELRRKYPLNQLTDEGVLPNYAFPEPGVRLESVIWSRAERGERNYHAREFVRPASSAIRELAPFNKFYADGHKVEVNEIDVGNASQSLLEEWRLCAECSYMERDLESPPAQGDCPRCGDSVWADAGQVRTLVHFRRSRSLTSDVVASTADDSDDREVEFYAGIDLIDVGPEHCNGARIIEELPFGIELLKQVRLRELNLGPEGSSRGFRVCGAEATGSGFMVCRDCGRVARGDGSGIEHHVTCAARRETNPDEPACVYLYREIQSEALRILLPVSEVGLETRRASFRAALQLGLRCHFAGDPGHLIVRSVREPAGAGRGQGTRQFLVIFDGVPGGTGNLAELWRGEQFLDMLQNALTALEACPCQREADRDGCYRCLFAYRSQREMPLISSRVAQETLRSIVARRDRWVAIETLSQARLGTKLESELEEKFWAALRARVEASEGRLSWTDTVQQGVVCAVLGVPAPATPGASENSGEGPGPRRLWEVRPQVSLGAAEGVARASRPDFLIRPLNADPAVVRSVAVFCDGLAYHVCPDEASGRIADDIEKRASITASGRYLAWSVSWKDVADFEKGPEKTSAVLLFDHLDGDLLGKRMVREKGLPLDRYVGQRGSMDVLLEYLRCPEWSAWERAAQAYGWVWLMNLERWQTPELGAELEVRLCSDGGLEAAGLPVPEPVVGEPGAAPVLTRYWCAGSLAALARSGCTSVRAGKVDTLCLRLFDHAAARSATAFEDSWRAFLHAWNFWQFHPGLRVVSSELLRMQSLPGAHPVDVATLTASQGAAERVDPAGRPVAEHDGVLAELLAYATEASVPLIRAVREAGLPLPVLEYELDIGRAGCGPEPELAWPEQKIALLATRQSEDRESFEAAGWRVFETPIELAKLLAALRERGAQD